MTEIVTQARPARRPARRVGRYVLLGYLALLVGSHLARWAAPPLPPWPDQSVVQLQAVAGREAARGLVELAYTDLRPAGRPEAPVLVLLHGSPMASRSMLRLAYPLADSFRVLVPDLPGMGRSTRRVPDYSVEAHGRYLVDWLDTLGIENAHLVAYSMGGGVALEAYDQDPESVASITMLSAIGVQELELFGDYTLNHAVHGLQLGLLWLLEEATPHFGLLDDVMINTAYARNFYDTDQRPLRSILKGYAAPMLILHGTHDRLVPFAVAEEHARLVPQSELVSYDGGHGLVFSRDGLLAAPIAAFVRRVEQDAAPLRAAAAPDRVAAAQAPFDRSRIPKADGITLAVLLLLLALATLVSEDLTCLGAGFLVAQGTMDFFPATLACFLGIFFGDVLLFLAGRYVGRPLVQRAPFRWMVGKEALAVGEAWLARRGPAVIVASRFVPGSRLPTYVAAGMLHTGFWQFTFYFVLACAVWTPLLVGLAVLFGQQVLPLLAAYQSYALLVALGAVLVFWMALKVVTPLFSHRGRRLFVSAWRRTIRWEFWPPWLFYAPVVLYAGSLALRYRSLTLFTAANPAIPAGGFVGESKAHILDGLDDGSGFLARFAVIEPDDDPAARAEAVSSFMNVHGFGFPIVLKPDVGERGAGVVVARSVGEVRAYLAAHPARTLAQEYAPGREFGVFYYRYPDEPVGRILSITDKRFPTVIGDGKRTLETLILDDDRAVCMAPFYLRHHGERIFDVPDDGESIQLVELGTHCRGAVFLDGNDLRTPALEAVFDRISKGFAGFYFGRYDVRTPSLDDFAQGRRFKIVELNGVTSEATHLYDPKNTLGEAYRVLRRQWRIAFEIGAQNVRHGASTTRLRELARLLVRRHTPPEAKA